MKMIMEYPEFHELNIFDRARVAAILERQERGKQYKTYDQPHTNQKSDKAGVTPKETHKSAGSAIHMADPIRGCDAMCAGCYANFLGGQSKINHYQPVRVHITGRITSDQLLRIGEVGDPSTDWRWSAAQVQALLNRSKEKDKNVSADNVYVITKLLNISGFDASVFRNLEVSFDPLNPSHMKQTAKNLLRLKAKYPHLNIVIRIRTVATKNKDLQAMQDWAVEFANRFDLPVIETMMRWRQKEYLDILELDKDKYKFKGQQYQLSKPLLRDSIGDWMVCDELKMANHGAF
jgi:hypothetical protein